MPKKPIHIKKGKADHDSEPLSKNASDEAQWFSDDDAYTITFTPDNPFVSGPSFQLPARGSVSSGPIASNAVDHKKYKYDVVKVGPAAGADPDVEINP